MDLPESLPERHRAEVLLSLISVAATTVALIDARITRDTAVIIDVFTALLALSVAILKGYFAKVAHSLSARQHRAELRTGQIASILESLGDKEFDHASVIVDSALENLTLIPKGVFRLDPSAYFRELINTMITEQKGTHVLAVSSMSVSRWTDDPREEHYLRENLAAIQRGVGVHRIFLLDKSKMKGADGDEIRRIIIQQRDGGVLVEIAWYQDIMHDRELHDDFVLFDDSDVVFVDEYDRIDPTRVLKGSKICNRQELDKYRRAFQALLRTYCLDRASVDVLLRG